MLLLSTSLTFQKKTASRKALQVFCMQRIPVKAVSLSISCLGFIGSKGGTVASSSIQDADDLLKHET